MASTENHTVLALSAAIATKDLPIAEKSVVLVGLALSHLILDAIPHAHFYDFARLRETWRGAIFELGIGGLGLLIAIWLISSTSFWWLFACVFAASAFDFGVAFEQMSKITLGISFINDKVHWWVGRITNQAMWIWEVFQTISLLYLLIYILIGIHRV